MMESLPLHRMGLPAVLLSSIRRNQQVESSDITSYNLMSSEGVECFGNRLYSLYSSNMLYHALPIC